MSPFLFESEYKSTEIMVLSSERSLDMGAFAQ